MMSTALACWSRRWVTARFIRPLWPLALLLSCGGGGGGGSTGGPAASNTQLTLTLPVPALVANDLAVIVAQGDAVSEAVASYYQTTRGIPAANIIRVGVNTASDTISAADFAALKAQVDAKLPAHVQATLVTWAAPSRVVGSCTMGLTSAMAFGFSPQWCANTCEVTAGSAYFDSESPKPWTDHGVRPSMMLGARTLVAAKALIDRGVRADASFPTGDGYLLRTTDEPRSVRYTDYLNLPSLWSGNGGLNLSYIDNAWGTASNSLVGKSKVLFYFTGLVSVPNLSGLGFVPGAAADHLTSFGGYLPGGNGQMPITAWLDAGATASFGAVAEPCNFTQKFSQASVLIDHYFRGDTLIEAYWKSVQWPGQGLFLGEPLAQPFRATQQLTISSGRYEISTRAMRPNSTYSLQYRTGVFDNWVTLASFRVPRAQVQTVTAPLAPAAATQLRWVGPCAANASQPCTLAMSG